MNVVLFPFDNARKPFKIKFYKYFSILTYTDNLFLDKNIFKKRRLAGIEPTSLDPQTKILPLNYNRLWGKQDLNLHLQIMSLSFYQLDYYPNNFFTLLY